MIDTKLTEAEILQINKLNKSIYENWKLWNDILMLLYDWIESLKNNLFYSSITTLTVFLEKYLRDTLIFYEYHLNDKNTQEQSFMEILEKIEEKIEDGKEKGKRYTFNKICDKLVKYWKIDEWISKKLKKICDDIRIPVHHWIYARIIKNQIWKLSIPITKIKTTDDMSGEDILKAINNAVLYPFNDNMNIYINDNMNIYNPIVRMFILPEFFKRESIKMLFIIDDLVKIIEWKEVL